MEERAKETEQRFRQTRYQVAASAGRREEMAWQLIGKRAGRLGQYLQFLRSTEVGSRDRIE